MAYEVKTAGLPPAYQIRKAVETIARSKPSGVMAVYLTGHGAERDFKSGDGVGTVFREYIEDIVPVFVPQDDYVRPGNYRPLLATPRQLKVKGATSAIIVDTSSKEFTVIDRRIVVPTSSSQSGAQIDILKCADYLEIPVIFHMITSDFFGTSNAPIDPIFQREGRPYLGPRKFLELNLVSLRNAAKEISRLDEYENFRQRLTTGKIIPSRLNRYERYLRKANLWTGKSLVEAVIPNLHLLAEIDVQPNQNGHGSVDILGAMRHA